MFVPGHAVSQDIRSEDTLFILPVTGQSIIEGVLLLDFHPSPSLPPPPLPAQHAPRYYHRPHFPNAAIEGLRVGL
eukprot:754827-Hanusia_phi.AAC.10